MKLDVIVTRDLAPGVFCTGSFIASTWKFSCCSVFVQL